MPDYELGIDHTAEQGEIIEIVAPSMFETVKCKPCYKAYIKRKERNA